MRHWLKYLLLGITLSLLIIFGQGKIRYASWLPPAVAQTTNTINQQNQARTLTKLGQEQLHQGQIEAALQTWQAARKLYRQLDNQEGVDGSLINQSQALQALGHYPQACLTLIGTLELQDWVCQSPLQGEQAVKESEKALVRVNQEHPATSIRVLGLHSLGNVLRLMGKLEDSETVLQQALKMAEHQSKTDISAIVLSLGNTERAFYNQAQERYQLFEDPISKTLALRIMEAKVNSVLRHYQQAESFTTSRVEAQLNCLNFILDLAEWSTLSSEDEITGLQALQRETQAQIKPLVDQLMAADFTQLPAFASVYSKLNFANSLMQLGHNSKLSQQLFPGNDLILSAALQIAQDALQVSRNLENEKAESYALGTIGRFYAQIGQPTQAIQHLLSASAHAESVQAWDIAYQWQQELGQLYQHTRNQKQAIQAYQAAINSLEQVRGTLLTVNPEFQFSFKRKVEPTYRALIRLLLATPNPDLEQIVQTNERLQLAELENYLQCGKLDFVPINTIQTENPSLAVIHVLNLGSQYEVIVRSADRSLHRYTASAEQVSEAVRELTVNLRDPRRSFNIKQDFHTYAQELYQLLIGPAQELGYLPNQGTLIFVLDSSLQSIPMSALYNGQRYLVQDYSISNAINSQLRPPKSLKPEQLKVLIAGLSEVSPSFRSPEAPANLTPLPEIKAEVTQIQKNAVASEALLNQVFTTGRFQDEVESTRYPILHISTHGQFSSDPNRTFVLAWDQPISLQQIKPLLQSRNLNDQSTIELLVLSACETARGDARSTLGIAGVAAQAGARSTIASLWLADAKATTELMGQLYQGLRAGKSKAEALRQAQIALLQNPEWRSPNYWAGFVLVGGWL